MAYSPPASVIAATPIGLRGEPPGMRFGSLGLSRLTSFGGDQAGCTYLPSIFVAPIHCLPGLPTATGYRIAVPSPFTRYRRRSEIRMTTDPGETENSWNGTISRA